MVGNLYHDQQTMLLDGEEVRSDRVHNTSLPEKQGAVQEKDSNN